MTATVRSDQPHQSITDESGSRLILSLPDDVLTALVGCLDLSDDWSSYKAPKPHPKTIVSAILVLQHWYPSIVATFTTHEIAPSLDGGVDLTFDREDQWVGLMLANNGSIAIERSDGVEATVDGASNVDSHMHWLLGKQ